MKPTVLPLLMLVCFAASLCGLENVRLRKDIEVYPLANGIWRHVTYKAGPANGLIVIGKDRAAMIDTPWTSEQTAVLLNWVEKELKAKVEIVVVGHHHIDCLGGLSELHRRGIRSIGLEKTRELALADKVEASKETFAGAAGLRIGGRELELFYPGPGHALDNIVTWIPDVEVLFGGCFVKSADAVSLGYTAESDLAAWPESLARMRSRFPEARIIVPGHGDPGGWELVDNTLRLLGKR